MWLCISSHIWNCLHIKIELISKSIGFVYNPPIWNPDKVYFWYYMHIACIASDMMVCHLATSFMPLFSALDFLPSAFQ